MLLTLIVVFLFILLIIHELAHAYAMIECGVEIEKISIGLNIPFIPRMCIEGIRQIPIIEINHLPIWAYVKNTESGLLKIESLSYKNKSYIYGFGVLANLITAFFLAIIYVLYDQTTDLTLWRCFKLIGIITIPSLLLFYGRRIICAYVLPFMGLLMLCLLIIGLFKLGIPSGSGPIGIARDAKDYSDSFKRVLAFTSFMSLNIALFNVLPIPPLDGGKIFETILARWVHKEKILYYQLVGGLCLLAFVAFIYIADIVGFVKTF